ncbi:MAG: nucleoside/nucleotide kinase family protein [Pseudomonadota bacterium]
MARLAAGLGEGERRIVAIAGAPGSGKSTLAERLVSDLGDAAALMPMDGFHYDDEVLVPRGWRARKGAPHTFDVAGLATTYRRLRAADADVAVPRFDRDLEIARAGAIIIPKDVPVIITEGNWLLLAEPPWDTLASLFDVTAMMDVPEAELHRRLSARWEGYALPLEEVAAKVDGNDMVNARLVIGQSRPADVTIQGTTI